MARQFSIESRRPWLGCQRQMMLRAVALGYRLPKTHGLGPSPLAICANRHSFSCQIHWHCEHFINLNPSASFSVISYRAGPFHGSSQHQMMPPILGIAWPIHGPSSPARPIPSPRLFWSELFQFRLSHCCEGTCACSGVAILWPAAVQQQ